MSSSSASSLSRTTPSLRVDAPAFIPSSPRAMMVPAPQSVSPKPLVHHKTSSNPTSGRIMLGLAENPHRVLPAEPDYSRYGDIMLANDPEFQVKPQMPVVTEHLAVPDRLQPDEDSTSTLEESNASNPPEVATVTESPVIIKSKHAIFTCAQCKKQFLTRFRLTSHQRATKHAGEKIDVLTPDANKLEGKDSTNITFDCVQCRKSFSDKIRLDHHQVSKKHTPVIAPLASPSVVQSTKPKDAPTNCTSATDDRVSSEAVLETDMNHLTKYDIALSISSCSSTSHITDAVVASAPRTPMCESVEAWVQAQHAHGQVIAALVLKDCPSSFLAEDIAKAQPDSRCIICDNLLPSREELETHVKARHRHLRCVLCGDVCTGQDAYITHHMTIHPPQEELYDLDSEPGSLVSSPFSSPASGWYHVKLDSRAETLLGQ